MMSLCVPMDSTGLDQGSLRHHFRRVRDLKMKKNKPFYGFTDFRGKPEKRGGWADAQPRESSEYRPDGRLVCEGILGVTPFPVTLPLPVTGLL